MGVAGGDTGKDGSAVWDCLLFFSMYICGFSFLIASVSNTPKMLNKSNIGYLYLSLVMEVLFGLQV